MSGDGHRPPAWIGALLERCIPGEHGGLIRAELDEEYRRFVRPRRGGLRARLWYGRQALGSILWRLRHRRRFPGVAGRRPGEVLVEDLRFGLRSCRRAPAFTVVALATIAVGIGATTLVFSVLDAVLLRPLPYPDSGALVRVWNGRTITKDVMEQVMEGTDSFAALSGVILERRGLSGFDAPMEVVGAAVTADHFSMLGATPMLGRFPVAGESAPGAPAVVVLSHELWRRAFGSDPGVVGTDVRLAGGLTTVVGVTGPEHRPLEEGVEYWRPMLLDPSDFSDYSGVAQTVLYGRLAPGTAIEQATAEVRAVAQRVHEGSPDAFDEDWVAASAPVPLHQTLVQRSRLGLWTVMGAVCFLLLIASVNVANLLLARARRRQREMAIRAGLGAAPGRLARQLLTESLLLGLAGGVLGLGVAAALVDVLRASLPATVPFASTVTIDLRVAGFVGALSLLTSALFGTLPALRVARVDPQSQLREATASASPGRRAVRAGEVCVGIEIALAVVLVAGAGLMLRSLQELGRVDPGFEPEGAVSVRVRLPGSAPYDDGAGRRIYFERLQESVDALPGVSAAGGTTFLPMGSFTPSAVYRVDGVEYPADRPPPSARFQLVVGDYFRAMGIPLLRGRPFAPTDGPEAPVVGLVNRALAREAFGDADPLGRRITMFGGVDFEVVGVVGDSHQTAPSQPPGPEAFFSYRQVDFWSSLYVVARGADGAEPDLASLRAAIWQVDDEIPINAARSLTDVVESASADSRFLARLLGGFAALALILGAVGVYGVMSYTVGERTYEFGIRRALGASAGHILRRAVAGALRPALAGVVAGTGAALALSGLLRGLLHGIAARDPLTFTVVPAVLVLVALLAAGLPARRAARVDARLSLAHGGDRASPGGDR